VVGGCGVGCVPYPSVVAASHDTADANAAHHSGLPPDEAALIVTARRNVGRRGAIGYLSIVDQDAAAPGLGHMEVGVPGLRKAVATGHGAECVLWWRFDARSEMGGGGESRVKCVQMRGEVKARFRQKLGSVA
jgi:hypothetical protein